MAVVGDKTYYAGSLVEQIIAAEAVVALPQNNVCMPLVTSIGRDKANQITVPVWNAGTHTIASSDVAAVTASTAISFSNLGSSKATATLLSYGVALPVYDEANDTSAEDINQRLGQIAAAGVGAKIDSLIAALFDGFTTNAVGSSVATFTVDLLFSALSALRASAAPGVLSYVGNPKSIWGTNGLMGDLVTSNQFGGSPSAQDEALTNGWIMKLAGVNLYTSAEVGITSSVSKGAVFSKESILFGYANPLIRVEIQREPLYLRWNTVASMLAGVVEMVDKYGCEVQLKLP